MLQTLESNISHHNMSISLTHLYLRVPPKIIVWTYANDNNLKIENDFAKYLKAN